MSEFADGWVLGQILGEGAYGEVRLVLNRGSGDVVAMKIIDLKKHPEASESVRKEVTIHTKLRDPHIIRCYGQRREEHIEYIFLEYAPGGELFDRIEPDVGMSAWEAQKYFKQLLAGVEYLHSRGVTHRDLKPENLLLDEHDNLKICDFGFATCFRSQGKERVLEKSCGTPQYVAPEVMIRPYHAVPAEIWTLGIILVAMLTGELPWMRPSVDCFEYMAWKDNRWTSMAPWIKLDNMTLSLLRKILVPLPSGRYSLQQIKSHRWSLKRFSRAPGDCSANPAQSSAKRLCSGSDLSVSMSDGPCSTRFSHSQPEPRLESANLVKLSVPGDVPFSFSQPAHLEDLLLSSQINPTQSATSQNPFQRLVRRMTRFFVTLPCESALEHLCSVLEKFGYSWKIVSSVVTITSVDKCKMQLVFKANVLDMDGKTLLDFRLSKGCGLEFKRRFLQIKESLSDVVLSGPITWPIAIATNTVP